MGKLQNNNNKVTKKKKKKGVTHLTIKKINRSVSHRVITF